MRNWTLNFRHVGAVLALASVTWPLSAHAFDPIQRPIDQARISWMPGKDVVACGASTVSSEQSCLTVRARSQTPDLVDVIQGDFIDGQAASWIEDADSGYTLCALSSTRDTHCTRLDMPELGGIRLVYAQGLSALPTLTLAFPDMQVGPNKAQREVLGQLFATRLLEARDALTTTLRTARGLSAEVAAFARPAWQFGTAAVPLPVDDASATSEPATTPVAPNIEPLSLPVSPVSRAAPVTPFGFLDKLACVAGCTQTFALSRATCPHIPEKHARYTCQLAAAAVYANCLVGCR